MFGSPDVYEGLCSDLQGGEIEVFVSPDVS